MNEFFADLNRRGKQTEECPRCHIRYINLRKHMGSKRCRDQEEDRNNEIEDMVKDIEMDNLLNNPDNWEYDKYIIGPPDIEHAKDPRNYHNGKYIGPHEYHFNEIKTFLSRRKHGDKWLPEFDAPQAD